MQSNHACQTIRRIGQSSSATQGFTLIELVMTVAVVAVLLGIALPAFSGSFEASRAMQTRTALLGTYLAALNGAAIANKRTTMCPSNDGNNCISSTDWSGGWIAFVDANADREHQVDERILSRQSALPGKVRLHSTVGRTRIEIQADDSVAGSNVTFTLCDGRGESHAQGLVLSNKSTLVVEPAKTDAMAVTCIQ